MPVQMIATAFGGPDSLSLVERPSAPLAPGEVRIAVRAAGVNPVDYKVYADGAAGDLPIRPGAEVAGMITEVGAEAAGAAGPVTVGDAVMAFRVQGGYTDELVTPAQTVVPKPPTLPWPEAGGLLLAGATAVHALTATEPGPGETVLIHGGAGGVGVMAVQLARLRGARVVATASERNHALLRELGAEPVTYGAGLAERVRAVAPGGIDVALDLVGTDEALDVSLQFVGARERIATIVVSQRAREAGVGLLGGAPGGDPGTEVRAAARHELAELVGAGKLRVVLAGTYPLREAREAHRAIRPGHTAGKIVLLP